MSSPRDDQQPFGFITFESFLGLLLFIARTFAITVEVFLRRPETFGDRYFGMQSVAALLLLFFFPITCDGEGMEVFLWYIAAYLTTCLGIRIRRSWRRWRREAPPHSYYSGTPRLMWLTGRMRETDVKATIEPLVAFVAGIALLPLSGPLGTYLMCAAAGLMISVRAGLESEHLRVLDLHDAYLDQRRVAERFRNLRGD